MQGVCPFSSGVESICVASRKKVMEFVLFARNNLIE